MISRKLVLLAASIEVILIVGIVTFFTSLSDFRLPQENSRDVTFQHGDALMAGTYVAAAQDRPIVLLVHGDGPQDRWSDDGYLPLVNALLDAGISVFSWDKQGVGESQGNWLDQSMEDRASETAAALTALRNDVELIDRPIGLLGFSQAGWVVPRVPEYTEEVSFVVVVGGAINWKEQGLFFAQRRIEEEGKLTQEIEDVLATQKRQYDTLFATGTTYDDYITLERGAGVLESSFMSSDRFAFVQRNIEEDVRQHIENLTMPVLVVSGSEDLNVDSHQTVSVYETSLGDVHALNRFELVPQATHSLLKAPDFNYQLPEQWSLRAKISFFISGRKAYAPAVLDLIGGWVNDVTGTVK